MLQLLKIKVGNSSFIKYIVVGVANTLIGICIIFSLKWFWMFGDVLSNIVGYSIGAVLAYALNKQWVFRYGGTVITSFPKFIIVMLIAYLANLCVVISFIDIYKVNSYVAQAIGVFPYTIIGFLGNKFFAFKIKTEVKGAL